MTENYPDPLAPDDQPTDTPETGNRGGWPETDTPEDAVAPSLVDFEDHERTDVDDPAKPGIDDFTD